MSTGALERVIQRSRTQRADVEKCDLCSAPLPQGHRHLLDTERDGLLCTCAACSLLFGRDAASEGHYRLVPERRVRLSPVSTARLGVPVGLAFFVPRADGAVVAHYPSPLGSTQWEVDADAWNVLVASCPPLDGVAPDVEALLVNTARDQRQCWIVPIADCLRLVSVVRREWRGLSGGSTVWPAIEEFFEGLA